MKLFDTSAVTVNASLPIKKGSLDLMRWTTQEMISEIVQELYPNNLIETGVYAVRGAEWTKSGSPETYTLQPGAIYVGAGAYSPILPATTGELFVLSAVQTVTPIDHPILVLLPQPYNVNSTPQTPTNQFYYQPATSPPGVGTGDPVVMTDTNSYYLHDLRQLVLVDGDDTTPGFVCYIDSTNPSGAPFPYLQYVISQESFQDIKEWDNEAPIGSPQTINTGAAQGICSVTPSATLNSHAMTFTFECQIIIPTSVDVATEFQLQRNGFAVKIIYIQSNPGNNSLSVSMVWVDTYTANDVWTVVANTNTGTTQVSQAILVAECTDAYA